MNNRLRVKLKVKKGVEQEQVENFSINNREKLSASVLKEIDKRYLPRCHVAVCESILSNINDQILKSHVEKRSIVNIFYM